MSERDDFPQKVKTELAKRAGYLCSKPDCRRLTVGPHSDENKSVSMGIASHITAASPTGPRYDPSLSADERSSISNAIWMCVYCATLVDKDDPRFPVKLLCLWRDLAEAEADLLINGPRATNSPQSSPLVVSHNQSGGQTALTIVNNGPQARRLAGRDVADPFLSRMRARKVVGGVVIVLFSPNGEVYRFADDMSIALAMIGINDGKTEPAIIYGPPTVNDVFVESVATDPGDPLLAFAEWMRSQQFKVVYLGGQAGNSIYIPPIM